MSQNVTVVRKRFVQVDTRVVHYRVAGQGIPVVLLHESPRSSRSLIPLLEHLGQRYRVIAPDTPGYGDSSALLGEFPPLSDFADALARFLDAIGIDRCVVYGSHTGGSIAAEFAERYPSRVSGLILDGFAIFTDAEKQDMVDNYLPPFEPKWDGSHIVSLWSRARDLFTYFPYHRRDPEHRIATELFSLDASYRTALGFLEAGNDYRGGYRASITQDTKKALQTITVPVSVVCREGDLLRHHLERIPSDAKCEIIAVSDEGDEWINTIEQRVKHYGAQLPSIAETSLEPWSDAYIDHSAGQMRVRRFGSEGGRPVLYLHDLPGSGADAAGLSDALGSRYAVIAPDLPNSADSHFSQMKEMDIATISDLIIDAHQASGNDEVLVVSNGASVGLGCELNHRLEGRYSSHVANLLGDLQLERCPGAIQKMVPDTVPNVGGGHLINAWFQIRDGLFYAPWYQRDLAHRRRRDPQGEVDLVQSRFTAWMKGPAIGLLAGELDKLTPDENSMTEKLEDADYSELAAAITKLT